MRRYWQKKPLLIRQAIPDIAGAAYARRAVRTRRSRRRRVASHHPFSQPLEPANTVRLRPTSCRSLKKREWTLLVQGVNLHHDRAHALMNRFRFIPDARLDDLMISLRDRRRRCRRALRLLRRVPAAGPRQAPLAHRRAARSLAKSRTSVENFTAFRARGGVGAGAGRHAVSAAPHRPRRCRRSANA